MKAVTALPLAFFLAALAWAAPASADKAYSQCIGRASMNPELAGCGEAFLGRLEVALNVAWKRANSSINRQSQKDLLKEQRAWLKFRDSSCELWANGSYGRDGEVLHFFRCRAAITEARISDLNGIYEFMQEHQ